MDGCSDNPVLARGTVRMLMEAAKLAFPARYLSIHHAQTVGGMVPFHYNTKHNHVTEYNHVLCNLRALRCYSTLCLSNHKH